LQKVR
ncbi:putative lipoprotein, partial [Chlamydia psittaci 84-8471/1]